MKMNKIVIPLLVCGVLIAVGLMFALQPKTTLSIAQITGLLEQKGIALSKPVGLHPANVFLRTLNGVAPDTFAINDSQLLSIYVYSSNREARKGRKDFDAQTATASVVKHSTYLVDNVLLFYVPEGSPEDERIEQAVELMRATE